MVRTQPLPALTTTISTYVPSGQHAGPKPPKPTVSESASTAVSVLEGKIVLVGAAGVGKSSIVSRFVDPGAPLPSQSTIGCSFTTRTLYDPDSATTVRLQCWDTAGQERFRSISKLYYRGAHAGILCYDVTSEKSWEEMKDWLEEMRQNCEFSFNESRPGSGMILHVVGTKTDLVMEDPSKRQVPFERTIAWVAEYLSGIYVAVSSSSTPPLTARSANQSTNTGVQSPDSKHSSGFWTQDLGWDSCHEVSAKDNDGIEEVFRVISKKLIEQRNKREAFELSQWSSTDAGEYFHKKRSHSTNAGSTGSFRLGHGHRRSWLGLPGVAAGLGIADEVLHDTENPSSTSVFVKDPEEARRKGRCC